MNTLIPYTEEDVPLQEFDHLLATAKEQSRIALDSSSATVDTAQMVREVVENEIQSGLKLQAKQPGTRIDIILDETDDLTPGVYKWRASGTSEGMYPRDLATVLAYPNKSGQEGTENHGIGVKLCAYRLSPWGMLVTTFRDGKCCQALYRRNSDRSWGVHGSIMLLGPSSTKRYLPDFVRKAGHGTSVLMLGLNLADQTDKTLRPRVKAFTETTWECDSLNSRYTNFPPGFSIRVAERTRNKFRQTLGSTPELHRWISNTGGTKGVRDLTVGGAHVTLTWFLAGEKAYDHHGTRMFRAKKGRICVRHGSETYEFPRAMLTDMIAHEVSQYMEVQLDFEHGHVRPNQERNKLVYADSHPGDNPESDLKAHVAAVLKEFRKKLPSAVKARLDEILQRDITDTTEAERSCNSMMSLVAPVKIRSHRKTGEHGAFTGEFGDTVPSTESKGKKGGSSRKGQKPHVSKNEDSKPSGNLRRGDGEVLSSEGETSVPGAALPNQARKYSPKVLMYKQHTDEPVKVAELVEDGPNGVLRVNKDHPTLTSLRKGFLENPMYVQTGLAEAAANEVTALWTKALTELVINQKYLGKNRCESVEMDHRFEGAALSAASTIMQKIHDSRKFGRRAKKMFEDPDQGTLNM